MNNDSWNIFDYHYSGSSSLVFNLSIPLYKASNFTKLKSNRIQMRQLDQNRIDTERKLNMQITSYQDNMAASSEQVSSNKENVMQAEKAVQIAGKRYEVGKGTVLELNTSQVQLTEAELADQGITPATIRLSIGTEDIEDIIWDLDQAFTAL